MVFETLALHNNDFEYEIPQLQSIKKIIVYPYYIAIQFYFKEQRRRQPMLWHCNNKHKRLFISINYFHYYLQIPNR